VLDPEIDDHPRDRPVWIETRNEQAAIHQQSARVKLAGSASTAKEAIRWLETNVALLRQRFRDHVVGVRDREWAKQRHSEAPATTGHVSERSKRETGYGYGEDAVSCDARQSALADIVVCEGVSVLFILAAIAFVAIVFFSMQDDRVMPFACPACSYDGQIGPPRITWYSARGSSVRCRSCSADFREHPDGSLVRDGER
jgi:hypothetical protein